MGFHSEIPGSKFSFANSPGLIAKLRPSSPVIAKASMPCALIHLSLMQSLALLRLTRKRLHRNKKYYVNAFVDTYNHYPSSYYVLQTQTDQ